MHSESSSVDSVGHKRKRSVTDENTPSELKKRPSIGVGELQQNQMDTNDSTNHAEHNNVKPSSYRNSSDIPVFSVSREDPIGLKTLKTDAFDLIQKTIDETDVIKKTVHLNILKYLIADFFSDDDVNFKRLTIDGLFREYLLEVILSNNEAWKPLLELSITFAKESIASAMLPIALLVDLIDITGLEECESIFKFIEDHLSLWQEPHFHTTCKNAVLRMCNDLLRRLSQTQNTIFCGRILIFLSAYFPFSERSGLNVMSEFNTEDVIDYKTVDDTDEPDSDSSYRRLQENNETLFEGMDLDIPGLDKVVAQCQEQKKTNLYVDYNMYVKFWTLQEYLKNPNLCYNKLHWNTFVMYLNDLLQALESSKLLPEPKSKSFQVNGDDEKEENESDQSHSQSSSECKEAEEVNQPGTSSEAAKAAISETFPPSKLSSFFIPKLEDENHYFAKYLTNRRVLELEMSDPQFRRSLFVQVLIVLQYLVLPVKFKTENQILNEEQLEFVSKTKDKIYSILLQIKPGGGSFVENIKRILKREEIWSNWKNDGCPPMKKPSPPPVSVSNDPKVQGIVEPMAKKNPVFPNDLDSSQEFDEGPLKRKSGKKPRPRIGQILIGAAKNKKYSLGNPELNRLWNICPDNLEACRLKTRDFTPTIDTYFAEAMKELDQEPLLPADPKKEVKPKRILGNQNFGWRGLRLLARKSPYFFQMVSGTPIHPLQNYLEFVLRKIAADIDSNNSQSLEFVKKIDTSPTEEEETQEIKSDPIMDEQNEELGPPEAEVVTASADDAEDDLNEI